MTRETEICIVGGGPAGMAAAIQLKRYGSNPVLIERKNLGGLLLNANLVENYPGFPRGITGLQLVRFMREQLQRFGVEVRFETVSRIDGGNPEFRLRCGEDTVICRTLILAAGTQPVPLQDGLVAPEIISRLHYEVYPLRGLREKHVAIIGAGDAAFDYALQLARRNEVTIYNRSERVRALRRLVELVRAHPKIRYCPNRELIHATGCDDGRLSLSWRNSNGIVKERADELLCALGRRPDFAACSPELLANRERLCRQRRLYIIGDLANDRYRQASIAVADGIRAAMQIEESRE